MALRDCILSFVLIAAMACAPARGDALKPDVIRWGASAAELEAVLDGKCAKGFVNRPIDPPFLPEVKRNQVQIDCDGLDFLGAPRWAEFVVGDDRLQMVWIMVEPEDQQRAVAALIAAYGEPSSANENYVAFSEHNAAWRSEPPEVLYYAEELAAWLEPQLASQN